MKAFFALLVTYSLLSGCTVVRPYEEADVAAMQRVQQRAYEAGVKDVMQDMKGKLQGTERFVYQPPLVECGVRVPGQVMNGALYPSHETCVTVAPGQWIEQETVSLPKFK